MKIHKKYIDMNEMNKSIALWLSNNSFLTDKQISEFCNITELEFKKIISENNELADVNPIKIGVLTKEEIKKCEKNESISLSKSDDDLYKVGSYSTKKDTHNEKLSAILWILKKNINVNSKKVASLLGVDISLVESIKKRTPLKINGVSCKSPFSLGLCNKKDQQNLL